MSRPAAKKAAPKGEYIETVSAQLLLQTIWSVLCFLRRRQSKLRSFKISAAHNTGFLYISTSCSSHFLFPRLEFINPFFLHLLINSNLQISPPDPAPGLGQQSLASSSNNRHRQYHARWPHCDHGRRSAPGRPTANPLLGLFIRQGRSLNQHHHREVHCNFNGERDQAACAVE